MTEFFAGVTVLQVVGFTAMLLFWGVLIRAHLNRRNQIDLTDLLTEYAAGRRRITMSRFSAFVGLLVGTWAFLYCATTGALADSWQGILAFMGICFGYRVSDSWLKNQRDAAAADGPQGTVTTTTVGIEQTETSKKGKGLLG